MGAARERMVEKINNEVEHALCVKGRRKAELTVMSGKLAQRKPGSFGFSVEIFLENLYEKRKK